MHPSSTILHNAHLLALHCFPKMLGLSDTAPPCMARAHPDASKDGHRTVLLLT